MRTRAAEALRRARLALREVCEPDRAARMSPRSAPAAPSRPCPGCAAGDRGLVRSLESAAWPAAHGSSVVAPVEVTGESELVSKFE